jgi:hypothetical protein
MIYVRCPGQPYTGNEAGTQIDHPFINSRHVGVIPNSWLSTTFTLGFAKTMTYERAPRSNQHKRGRMVVWDGMPVSSHSPRWPSSTFISLALDRPEAKAWISQHAIGATLPNLNTGIISAVPLIVPTETFLRAFTKLVDPMEQLISANNDKSHTLAMLRDTLLPRLISGKLRVPEAEKLADAVL